jgi:flagellar biosynthesis protein FlhG
VIAVGGGRGGVGKTLLSVNLAVYFAQLGRDVVLCDADPFGSSMHTVLGLVAPPLVNPDAAEEGAALPVATSVPGLRLMPSMFDPTTMTQVRPTRASHWFRQIQSLDVDYVILHLGASTTSATLELFSNSDVGICVTAPEPLAVESTYRFVRSLYFRALRRALTKERFKWKLVEKAAAALPPLAGPRELIVELRRYDDAVALAAAQQLGRVTPRLVVGQTRLKSDLDLGHSMTVIGERFLGIAFDYLGHIEQDDAVWLTVRRMKPLLIDSPASKSARNIERVARRILAMLAAQATRGLLPRHAEPVEDDLFTRPSRPPDPRDFKIDPPATLYDVLGVSRTSTDDEIRRAYKRQREIFREGGLPDGVGGEPDGAAQGAGAHRGGARHAARHGASPRLRPLDLPRRRARGGAGPHAERFADGRADDDAGGAGPRDQRRDAVHRRAAPQGPRVAGRRDPRHRPRDEDLERAHPRDRERVPRRSPAAVYVQGFVQQIARFLKLDPAQVTKTYMRRLRDAGSRTVRGS